MTDASVKKIAVFGNGLAGLLCVAKLAKILPKAIELTYVESCAKDNTDMFFGTVTPPSTYDFLLGIDVTEPDFLPSTNTSFSLGTRYKNWGTNKRGWTQSFHRPLPTYNGVEFHHYLTKLRSFSPDLSDIESYIMSVQAAESGVFAHPPEGKNIPLADVEYGYHFLPEEWSKVIESKIDANAVQWVKADVLSATRQGDIVSSVNLSNGQTIEADFIIDALGPQSKLAHPDSEFQTSGRHLKAVTSFVPTPKLEGVCRVLTATNYGWKSETPLQNGTHSLTVYSPNSEAEALSDNDASNHAPIDIKVGRLSKPWSGNCLSLGHGAAIVEPLTSAPILLLQRDTERLAELIPVKNKMTVESREYNRRFHDDYEHAEMFSRAFFVSDRVQSTPYWTAASSGEISKKLLGKIEQFKSRGVAVQYDYEPFTARDWTVLHLGLGRYPERYDPLADHFPEDQLKNKLTQMNTAIKMMAKKMPQHHIYMTGLLKYLKDKHG